MIRLNLVEVSNRLFAASDRELFILNRDDGALVERTNPIHNSCRHELVAMTQGAADHVIVVGHILEGHGLPTSPYMAMLSTDGTEVWNQVLTYPGLQPELYQVGEGFVVARKGALPWVQRFSATGEEIWFQDYSTVAGGFGNHTLAAVTESCYGGVILVLTDGTNSSIHLIKTDVNGTI